MKYRDRRFQSFQEKQRDNIGSHHSSKSDRQIRREQEHRISIFYSQNLSSRIEKLWWVNLKISDKESIISHYRTQEIFFSYKKEERNKHWFNHEVFDSWNEWFQYIKENFQTDRVSYRNDKLKSLGI